MEKLQKALELLKFLPAVVGAIVELVKHFEVPGFGAEKKEAVLSVIKLVYDTLSAIITLPIEKDKLIGFVSKAIDGVISFLNAIKIFKHGSENPTL